MLKRISLDLITRNPDQPRQHFEPIALQDLADSIAQNGLAQPITVRPIDPDAAGHRYMVIMGERRFRAHRLLQQAGKLDTILCHVRAMDDKEMHINAILENLQRAEVSPIEEAVAYQRAISDFGFTATDLASKLGVSQVWRITDRIALLGLTLDNRDLIAKGIVTLTQAYHMARLSPNGQARFLDLVKQGLVSTNQAASAAATAIAAKEAQIDMFAPAPSKPRLSLKTTEDQIDRIGAAVAAMFSKNGFEISDEIDASEAHRCIEKIKMLRANLGQIEREITRAASLTAAVAA